MRRREYQPVSYKGTVYNTVKECLLENGLSEQRYHAYKHALKGTDSIKVVNGVLVIDNVMGKLEERCIDLDAEMSFSYTYNGIEYTSIISYCKAMKTPFDLVYKRLQTGMASDEAVRVQEINTDTRQSFSFNGKQYDSISKCLKDLKLPVTASVFCNRMRRFNETVVEALNYYIERVEEGAYTGLDYEGMHFDSLADACRVLGLNYANVKEYKKVHKLSSKDALDCCIRSAVWVDIQYKGKDYPNLISVCKEYDLNPVEVQTYADEHLSESVESILDKFVDAKLPFRVRGKGYSTLPDACKSLNIVVQDVFGYKRSHMELSIQDVLDEFSNK